MSDADASRGATLSPEDEAFAVEVADAFDARLDLRARSAEWDAHRVTPAMAGLPVLQLDDVSGIPFLEGVVGVEYYQLRARVRARPGDLFAATCPDIPAYERYNRDHLGLGDVQFVEAPPSGPPIRVAEACRVGPAFDRLLQVTRDAGGLVIHPYMGIEPVWALARDLAARAGAPVGVLAPPPPVTWFANDKRHLTDLARQLVTPRLGTDAVVPTLEGTTADALATHLLALAARPGAPADGRVALKLTRCASAMGNGVFAARDLLAAGHAKVARQVAAFLEAKQWEPGDPVLAVVWEDTDVSPSSQLWIPPAGEGAPRLDGLYEQILHGPERIFWGSVPSRLAPDVHAWLARASLLVARAYQHLGYVGRCSFDFILAGPTPVFVECNGRWGGTSTPMHLVDRLFPAGRPAYRARDVVVPHLVGGDFQDVLDALGDLLYDHRTGQGRFVLYNVGCLPQYGKLDVIALGRDVDDATHALEVLLPERLRLP